MVHVIWKNYIVNARVFSIAGKPLNNSVHKRALLSIVV